MKKCTVIIALILSVLSSALPVSACTLYSAQGSAVLGGRTIIGKNRDYLPDVQQLKVVSDGRYSYYALFGGKNPAKMSIRAGVNEKGLAVVSAMAGCIPKKERSAMRSKPVMPKVLANCSSVDEALSKPEYFLGPRFLMLADKNETAYVEIADGGKTSVKRVQNGTLAHTNYYLDPEFSYCNIKYGESAHCRYDRICELLDTAEKPLTLEKFITFSQDMNAGADNSLWRTGSRKGVSETLAAFIVCIEQDGNFSVWVKYRPTPDAKGREKIVRLGKSEIFGHSKNR